MQFESGHVSLSYWHEKEEGGGGGNRKQQVNRRSSWKERRKLIDYLAWQQTTFDLNFK